MDFAEPLRRGKLTAGAADPILTKRPTVGSVPAAPNAPLLSAEFYRYTNYVVDVQAYTQ